MSDASELKYHIEIGLIGSSRIIRTHSLPRTEANKFFGLIVMKYVDRERSLFSLAYGLEDICIPTRAIAWIELVEG